MSDKTVLFCTVPLVEVLYPSAAYGCLKPIAEQKGHRLILNDFNLVLRDRCSEQDFNEINDWCMFAKSTISEQQKNLIIDVFHQTLHGQQFQWLAISVFSFYSIRPTALILRSLPKHRSYQILLGGNGCMSKLEETADTEFGNWALDQKLCDAVIFGEGEAAFGALLQGDLNHPGINSTNFQQINDLDGLPLPDYSGIQWEKYADPRILITGSRGCVRHCTFCDIDLTWPKFTYRSAKHLVEQIRRARHEYGLNKFEFTDSLINGSIKNFNEFNDLLIAAKQKDPVMEDVTYTGQFICRNRSSMSATTYELMHYAGCSQITVGIESFSERVRYHMKKKFSDADIDYHFEQCGRWRIPNVLLLIVGYPTETAADHQQNIRALHRYRVYSDTGIIFMARWGLTMHIYENTPISNMSKDLGLRSVGASHGDSVFNWIADINPGLDLRERIRRRLEIHETSVDLGYSMPNSRRELITLLSLCDSISATQKSPNRVISIINTNQ